MLGVNGRDLQLLIIIWKASILVARSVPSRPSSKRMLLIGWPGKALGRIIQDHVVFEIDRLLHSIMTGERKIINPKIGLIAGNLVLSRRVLLRSKVSEDKVYS
jgi:hypothetical protein